MFEKISRREYVPFFSRLNLILDQKIQHRRGVCLARGVVGKDPLRPKSSNIFTKKFHDFRPSKWRYTLKYQRRSFFFLLKPYFGPKFFRFFVPAPSVCGVVGKDPLQRKSLPHGEKVRRKTGLGCVYAALFSPRICHAQLR